MYTLIVKADNTFRILINNAEARSGSLLHDVKPSVNPPKEIDDPTDVKPEDWVEEAKYLFSLPSSILFSFSFFFIQDFFSPCGLP